VLLTAGLESRPISERAPLFAGPLRGVLGAAERIDDARGLFAAAETVWSLTPISRISKSIRVFPPSKH